MAPTKWKNSVVKELRALYADDSMYAGLTQLDHALQAANLAATSGAPDHEIVAALLHDVGWKLARCSPFRIDAAGGGTLNLSGNVSSDNDSADEAVTGDREQSLAARLGILKFCGSETSDSESQKAQHDLIGAIYLRMKGFDERIPHLVEGHVLAKRYLCFKEPGYHSKLSPGSKRTLKFQGGPMTAEEAAVFEKDPMFERCLQMRLWDDEAKIPELEVPDFDSYTDKIRDAIVHDRRSADDAQGTASFVRKGNTIVGLRPTHDSH